MEENMKVINYSEWDLSKGYVDYTDDWFLMSSPITPLLITAVYLMFVLKIGPAFMKGRPAFELRRILHIYNTAQIIYSVYLVYMGVGILMQEGLLERKCMLQDEEYTYKISAATHAYLLGKMSELLDTVLFVLRKKWTQASFLHVYHHTAVFVSCWVVLKYTPSGSYLFTGTLNSFVHIIMYTYYGLAAFPRLRKYLWWKKYITKIQLIQFIMGISNLTLNRLKTSCQLSHKMLYVEWFQFILLTYLFVNFYIDSYKKEDMSKNGNGFQGKNDENNKQKPDEKRI